jgi:hypothetical protein
MKNFGMNEEAAKERSEYGGQHRGRLDVTAFKTMVWKASRVIRGLAELHTGDVPHRGEKGAHE